MRKSILSSSIAVFLFSILVTPVFAIVGVGVNTGYITVDEQLSQGGVYNLPPIGVNNTGDEASSYRLQISYHQDQEQLLPPADWFSFNPNEFYLRPNESQQVAIQLFVPVETMPGDYFAYVEAVPLPKEGADGGTSVGVAAATKLSFTIAPSNVFQAIYSRVITLWQIYMPWSALVTAAIFLVAFLYLLSKKVKIHLEIAGHHKRKSKRKKRKRHSMLHNLFAPILKFWKKDIYPELEEGAEFIEEEVMAVEHEVEEIVEDAFEDVDYQHIHSPVMFALQLTAAAVLFWVTVNLPELPGKWLIDPTQLAAFSVLLVLLGVTFIQKIRASKSSSHTWHVGLVAFLLLAIVVSLQVAATPYHLTKVELTELIEPQLNAVEVAKEYYIKVLDEELTLEEAKAFISAEFAGHMPAQATGRNTLERMIDSPGNIDEVADKAVSTLVPDMEGVWICRGRTCQYADEQSVWTTNLNTRIAGAALSFLVLMVTILLLMPPVHVRRRKKH